MVLPPASSFFRRWAARRDPPNPDDAADLGTAFGLDASLGPISAYPSDPGGASKDGQPAAEESPMGWLGRRPKRPR